MARDYLEKVNKVGDNLAGADTLNAGETNSVFKEIKNLILSSGLNLGDVDNVTGEDLITNQVSQAIFLICKQAGIYQDNSIVANQFILEPSYPNLIRPSVPFFGQKVIFLSAFANTGASTIKVGSYLETGLKNSNGTDISSGTIEANEIIELFFDGVNYRIKGTPQIVRTGEIVHVAYDSSVSNALYCDGSEVSRSLYANLFAKIGILYGAGDGSTTFNIPDYRDMVLYGAGADVSLGEYKEDQIQNITGSFRSTYNNTTSLDFFSGGFTPSSNQKSWFNFAGGGNPVFERQIDFDASNSVRTGSFTAPKRRGVKTYIYI